VSRKRVLVVDDEPYIVHVVSMKLRNAGYDVVTAADGEEALELCLAEPPDLLITDCQMPFLSGLELCKELRNHDATKHVTALMLTAREFDVTEADREQAGLAEVLAKPFSPREMLARVHELLAAASTAGRGR
jgi:DNA-binding response OmpR family regulator